MFTPAGVEQDLIKGKELLAAAALQGNEQARHALGIITLLASPTQHSQLHGSPPTLIPSPFPGFPQPQMARLDSLFSPTNATVPAASTPPLAGPGSESIHGSGSGREVVSNGESLIVSPGLPLVDSPANGLTLGTVNASAASDQDASAPGAARSGPAMHVSMVPIPKGVPGPGTGLPFPFPYPFMLPGMPRPPMTPGAPSSAASAATASQQQQQQKPGASAVIVPPTAVLSSAVLSPPHARTSASMSSSAQASASASTATSTAAAAATATATVAATATATPETGTAETGSPIAVIEGVPPGTQVAGIVRPTVVTAQEWHAPCHLVSDGSVDRHATGSDPLTDL
jgi:hypothetical protein